MLDKTITTKGIKNTAKSIVVLYVVTDNDGSSHTTLPKTHSLNIFLIYSYSNTTLKLYM